MALALFDMLENAGDDIGFGDFANHTKLPPAVGTHTDIDIKNALEPGHPSHRRARWPGVIRLPQ